VLGGGEVPGHLPGHPGGPLPVGAACFRFPGVHLAAGEGAHPLGPPPAPPGPQLVGPDAGEALPLLTSWVVRSVDQFQQLPTRGRLDTQIKWKINL